MKKIAFVIPWFGMEIPGGAEAELRGLALHLAEAGVPLEILTTCVKEFGSNWNKNYHKEGVYTEAGLTVRRFKVRKRDTAAFDTVNIRLMHNIMPLSKEEEQTFVRESVNSPALCSYIEEHLDDYGCFVFIPYMFGTTYYGIQAAAGKAVMIPCLHDESYAYLRVFREEFSKVAGMTFLAKPESDLAHSLYDLTKAKTAVLGAGVDTELKGDAEAFRRKYGISGDFILYAGRKDAGKKVDTLIRYFAEYKKRHGAGGAKARVSTGPEDHSGAGGRNVSGAINGLSGFNGPEDHSGTGGLKDAGAVNGQSGFNGAGGLKLVLIGGGSVDIPADIAGDVMDLGFVDVQDKYDAYAAATLLCQPSFNESFSIVIMESWLAGRPVMVADQCAVTKNFCRESNGGLWFRDYPEFEAALTYILTRREEADAMGQSGRAYVLENFAWDRIVEKYTDFFEEISGSAD